jgi:hypothetical protein
MKNDCTFVNEIRMTCVKCDECGHTNHFHLSDNTDELMIFECESCGYNIRLRCNRRKCYRKQTNYLTGLFSYTNHPGRMDGAIFVMNLSLTGILFGIETSHTLKAKDIVYISFKLDNQRRTTVSVVAQVVRVDGHIIAANFTSDVNNKDFAFYMFP